MSIVYPLPVCYYVPYQPPAYIIHPPYRSYLCPYCGHPLIWLPSNHWYCPYHGI